MRSVRPAAIQIPLSVRTALAIATAHTIAGVRFAAFDGGGPCRPVLLRAGDVLVAIDVRAGTVQICPSQSGIDGRHDEKCRCEQRY